MRLILGKWSVEEEVIGRPGLLPMTTQFGHCAKVSGKGESGGGNPACSLLANPWVLWSSRREVLFVVPISTGSTSWHFTRNALLANTWL